MRELDLEVAGEYLVMAATLAHIKSRLLLPPDPDATGESPPDPRRDLAGQLLEYQRFKQAAENLQAIDAARGLVWTREGFVPAEFACEELLAVDLFDLLAAFRGLLARLDEDARVQLRRDTVFVAEKIRWLTDLLEESSSLDLLACLTRLPTRLDRIAAFLALLEMMRLNLVMVFQRRRLGEIRIARSTGPVGSPPDEGSPS
jgi:segregation and condensation protein A